MALSGTYFNATYYLTQNSDVANNWSGSALNHYIHYGASEGRAPNAWFDAQYYRSTYTDLQSMTALELFEHYEAYGYAEGRVPDSTYANFDEQQYLDDYSDLGTGGITTATALNHYLLYGASENRTVKNDDGTTITGSTSSTGETYTLTTGQDILTGTANNDTFIGAVGTGATLGLADQIDGGAGTDTLKIFSDGTVTIPAGITSIENIYVNDDIHQSYNISSITGVTNLELDGGVTVAAGDAVLTVAAGQSITLDSITDGNAAADGANQGEISIASAASVTSLTIGLDGVGAQTVATATALTDLDLDIDGTGVTTAAITATGINNVSLANTGNALTNITVTGAGDLKFWGALTAKVKSFDASTATGSVTADLSASTATTLEVKGGSGNDTLTLDISTNGVATVDAGAGDDVVSIDNSTGITTTSVLNSTDSIVGGDGTDTIVMDAATADALDGDTDRSVITGFEQIRFFDDLNGKTIDISKFGFNMAQIAAATTTGAATINGFTSGGTIEYRAAADSTVAVNIGMTNATDAGTLTDTLEVKLNSNLVVNEIDNVELGVDGINILNVSTADNLNTDGATDKTEGYFLTLTSAKSTNVATINVTGDRMLDYNTAAGTTALATFDASALTGQLSVDLSAFAGTQGVTVKGGTVENILYGTSLADALTGGATVDILSGGAGNDVISAGAGADIIVGGAGTDKMTGGDGADVFDVSASTIGTGTSVDSITDFVAGTDKIAIGTAPSSITNVTTNLDSQTTLSAAAALAGASIGSGNAGTFSYNSHTYLLVDANTNASYTDGTDILVDVTGITGSLATTDFTTTATLTGLTSGDVITGTAAADTITSGGGNDVITGGAGADTITGGAGIDTITWVSTTSTALAVEVGGAVGSGNTGDTISTWTSGTDKLNFAAALTNNGTDTDTLKEIAKGGTVADNDVFVQITDTAVGDAVDTLAGAVTVLNALTTSAVAIGEDVIFAMDNDTNTYLYLVSQISVADTIAAQDVTYIGVISNITDVANGDFVSV